MLNRLLTDDNPLLDHAFLCGLKNGQDGLLPDHGWLPYHLGCIEGDNWFRGRPAVYQAEFARRVCVRMGLGRGPRYARHGRDYYPQTAVRWALRARPRPALDGGRRPTK